MERQGCGIDLGVIAAHVRAAEDHDAVLVGGVEDNHGDAGWGIRILRDAGHVYAVGAQVVQERWGEDVAAYAANHPGRGAHAGCCDGLVRALAAGRG